MRKQAERTSHLVTSASTSPMPLLSLCRYSSFIFESVGKVAECWYILPIRYLHFQRGLLRPQVYDSV